MLRAPEEADFPNLASNEVVQERAHFGNVIRAYASYQVHALRRIQRAQDETLMMKDVFARFIPRIHEGINFRRSGAIANQSFLSRVVEVHNHMAGLADNSTQQLHQLLSVPDADFDKVRSCLLALVRDWSAEGAPEREACFDPILAALKESLPVNKSSKRRPRVLVPGSGAGRLAYEVASLGYACQGIEFSYFMLILSDYMLNSVTEAESETIHPFILQFSNVRSILDAVRPIQIPDVLPTLPHSADFSIAAGDFTEVYNTSEHIGAWDAVVTAFFIDTAKDVTRYLQIIHRILRPGGVWINNGPLLYHYEEMNEPSLELTLEDIMTAAQMLGFTIRSSRTIPCQYSANRLSMGNYTYQCAFFVAEKAAAPAEKAAPEKEIAEKAVHASASSPSLASPIADTIVTFADPITTFVEPAATTAEQDAQAVTI